MHFSTVTPLCSISGFHFRNQKYELIVSTLLKTTVVLAKEKRPFKKGDAINSDQFNFIFRVDQYELLHLNTEYSLLAMTNPKRVMIYILSNIDEFDYIICLNANCRCDFIVLH